MGTRVLKGSGTIDAMFATDSRVCRFSSAWSMGLWAATFGQIGLLWYRWSSWPRSRPRSEVGGGPGSSGLRGGLGVAGATHFPRLVLSYLMPTYWLDVAYDGSGWGLASQPGLRTVQGEIEAALARALRAEVVTVAAGRTDAGVHARQQVMSFKLPCQPTAHGCSTPSRASFIPRSFAALAEVEDGFDARHSATARTYRYRINNRPCANPWAQQAVWHVPEPSTSVRWMSAPGVLIGDHDFAAFCRASSAGGTRRRITMRIWREDELLTSTVRAGSFCHQMVRSIVGLSVEIGRGRRQPRDGRSARFR